MRKGLPSLAVAFALAAFAIGCGGGDDKKKASVEDPDPGNNTFHIGADARPFAGPVPLKVKFVAQSFNEKGNVKWKWDFDDGTTSTDQNPAHTFPRAGYYYVRLIGVNGKNNSPQNFLLGAWPKQVWDDASQPGPIDPKKIRKRIRDQHKRTAARKRELKKAGKATGTTGVTGVVGG